MELLTETVADRELTEYEIERNKPMPSLNHAVVQSNIVFELRTLLREQYSILPEISIIMPEKPDAVPDIAIYPRLEIDFLEDKIAMNQFPLTTIEILSPTQTEGELLAKVQRYFAAGVQSCWIVLPIFKAIAVFSSADKSKVFTEDMTLIDQVTEIQLPLAVIFN